MTSTETNASDGDQVLAEARALAPELAILAAYVVFFWFFSDLSSLSLSKIRFRSFGPSRHTHLTSSLQPSM